MRRVLPVLLLTLIALPCGITTTSAQEEQSNPDAPSPYVTPGPQKSVEIGDFYFKRKRYAGALSRYKEAVQADPHFAPAYLGLGKVYERMGLKQKALEAYQRYLDELPSKKQADEATEVHRAIERLRGRLAKASDKTPVRH
jgi:tetratricopeptide (TPR) repeat protein